MEAVPGEEPNLHHIQGLTPKIIDRLSEEEIYSTEHLANADPIKLLLRTKFEWKVILDIIDQAILFNYTGERITNLRTLGIRGAIELAEIGTHLQITDDEAKQQAESMVPTIASTLEVDEHVVKQLMYTLIEDPQLDFIWTLWGEAFEEQPSE